MLSHEATVSPHVTPHSFAILHTAFFRHIAHRILSPYCTPHSFIFHTALTAHSQRTLPIHERIFRVTPFRVTPFRVTPFRVTPFRVTLQVLLSVVLLGTLVSDVITLRYERQMQLERINQLARKLDEGLISSLVLRAKELRPRKARQVASDGITELEFVLAMLIQLEMIQQVDIDPLFAQFRSLDQDGSGVLNEADLGQIAHKYRERTKEALDLIER